MNTFHWTSSCSWWNCFMVAVFLTAWTSPVWRKLLTWTTFAVFLSNIMSLIWMLAYTLEILRSVNWQINIIGTFTSCCFTFQFVRLGLAKIIVIFIEMVAKTLGRRPNILARFTIGVRPCGIEPVFRECLMLFLILLKFLFWHHDPSIIANNIAILNVRIDMLHYFFYLS